MKKLFLLLTAGLVGFASYSSRVSGITADKIQINFAEHIAPIFQNRCEECHRAGAVAPMSLAAGTLLSTSGFQTACRSC